MKTNPNIILMHGKDTNTSKKRYSRLKLKTEENKLNFVAPNLPNTENPDINERVEKLTKTKPDENSILIGHSRGDVAILRYLEKQEINFKVKKVILVATNSGKIENRKNTKGLSAKFLKFTDRGHFGSTLDKQEIPELLKEIKLKL